MTRILFSLYRDHICGLIGRNPGPFLSLFFVGELPIIRHQLLRVVSHFQCDPVCVRGHRHPISGVAVAQGAVWPFDVTAFGQTQQPPAAGAPQQMPAQQSTGGINGTVVDSSGAVIVGARVTLTRADQSGSQEVLTGGNDKPLCLWKRND